MFQNPAKPLLSTVTTTPEDAFDFGQIKGICNYTALKAHVLEQGLWTLTTMFKCQHLLDNPCHQANQEGHQSHGRPNTENIHIHDFTNHRHCSKDSRSKSFLWRSFRAGITQKYTNESHTEDNFNTKWLRCPTLVPGSPGIPLAPSAPARPCRKYQT